MIIKDLSRLLWFILFINFVLSETDDEYDLIIKSKKIIENLEYCESISNTRSSIHPFRENNPLVRGEKDILCEITKMVSVKTLIKNNLNERLFNQATEITTKAIKKAISFADLSMIIENEMNEHIPGSWLVLASNITHPGHPLEKLIKEYMDIQVAHVRVRVFDLKIRSREHDSSPFRFTTSTSIFNFPSVSEATIYTQTSTISDEKLKTDLLKLKEKLDGFDLTKWVTDALQENDIYKLNYIFGTKNLPITSRLANGKTLLHLAVELNKLDMVKYLIDRDKKIDVNALDDQGRTPLHYAAARSLDTVIYLTKKGADINARDANGFAPACYSIIAKKLPILRHLIENLGFNPRFEIARGYQLIHMACNYGCDHCVEYLVTKQGVDINTRSEQLYTPLHESSKHKNIKLVRWLVNHPKIDLNARDYENKTALMAAEEIPDNDEVIQVLRDKELEFERLVTATTTEPSTLKPSDLDKKHEKEPVDAVKKLSKALQTDNFKLFKSLFDNNELTVHQRFERSKSVLHFVADFDLVSFARFLIEDLEMDVIVRDYDAKTVLHYGACRSLELFKYLVEKNADINLRDNEGNMPIHIASECSDGLKIVRFLIEENNQDPNVSNIDGSLPLNIAYNAKRFDTVNYLLNLNTSL